ncbi:hypothetical protein PC9H_009689 [Pleurotus ostreatus]|uniref:Nitrogen permease regulator 3 n=1 Tax=Pleurotus ostreatus TaxID=5322 RepID=A0A8H6ZPI9_PLEOS|nr:uncharacterized protein PC9H_009689 [Pleurotus ostreatus]KAF7424382.1 hypothetical protein PC9H_009689 [Pleurotus ostreatus]
MAETLLGLLLVTSSAKGSSLVFRWPPSPSSTPRYKRARPGCSSYPKHLDNPYRASHYSDAPGGPPEEIIVDDNESDYQWKRPSAMRDRSMSFTHAASHSASGGASPSEEDSFHLEEAAAKDDYDRLLGYSSEFLAGLLCPQRSLCHQKFELFVDDLAFIGHPVCAEKDGGWRFRLEKGRMHSRGRESRNDRSPASSADSESPGTQSAWLHTFHLVLVLDLPDPSSSAAGNVDKYFDIIYEQIAFTTAAVLFQEQVMSNFVEAECDHLGSIKDACVAKDTFQGEPLSAYVAKALEASSIAPAMKTIYEAIKSSTIAYITIHYLPLELQLPPYLDSLLHSEEDDEMEYWAPSDGEDSPSWGVELKYGWRLPILAPWKSILLLDGPADADPYANLRGPHLSAGDRTLAEGLLKFLELASVILSLADLAALLDWDLEAQVYPTVRWLVLHRRAKVIDTVHAGLKTIFTLPPKFDEPLSTLSAEFSKDFASTSVPPLPQILAIISNSASKQSENHFFATVVRDKAQIPLYHNVVLWMLKRDLLHTLHLRIRVVATRELKARVKADWARHLESKRLRKGRRSRNQSFVQDVDNQYRSSELQQGISWLSLSPKSARRYSRRKASNESRQSKLSELIIPEAFDEDLDIHDRDDDVDPELDEEDEEDEDEVAADENGSEQQHPWSSMINDPGTATPLERRWLAAMSEGKDPRIARRFEHCTLKHNFDRSSRSLIDFTGYRIATLYMADVSYKREGYYFRGIEDKERICGETKYRDNNMLQW